MFHILLNKFDKMQHNERKMLEKLDRRNPNFYLGTNSLHVDREKIECTKIEKLRICKEK